MESKKVVQELETNVHCQNADNDDFYLIDHIPEILSFLDANDDYVGCRGQLVYIDVYNYLCVLVQNEFYF